MNWYLLSPEKILPKSLGNMHSLVFFLLLSQLHLMPPLLGLRYMLAYYLFTD